MKKLFFVLISIALAVPALADPLQPVPTDQAIGQYQDFWATNAIDPANHVVWKLYVFRAIPYLNDPKADKKYVIAGLTPFAKSSYYVRIRIDLLYNYFKTTPQRGDVMVVSGRVITRQDYLLDLTTKEVPIKILTMELDGAAHRPLENFDPAAMPMDSKGVSIAFTPTAVPVPVVMTPTSNP
jgi:hypothetical protein